MSAHFSLVLVAQASARLPGGQACVLFRQCQDQNPTGFTGCGKKRKTVILSAEFARRIPLGLFIFNWEGFFASLRMTTNALFPQPVQPVLLDPPSLHGD
jgi:hypothetical protein